MNTTSPVQSRERWPSAWTAALAIGHAMISADAEEADPYVHPDFIGDASALGTPIGTSKADFLRGLNKNEIRVDSFLFRFSKFENSGTELRLSPVIARFMSVPGYPLNPWAFVFREIDDAWLLQRIEMLEAVPQDLQLDLPEHHVLYDVHVTLRDIATGEPVHARVHISDDRGEYWPPFGHNKHISIRIAEGVGGDVLVNGEQYAYVEPEFVVKLPNGRYRIRACRGPEYKVAEGAFEVQGQHPAVLELSLHRWIDMADEGWYSGDTHIHFLTPQVAVLEAQGEDLNVASLLATSFGTWRTNTTDFTGAVSPVSTKRHIVRVNQEARHDRAGHLTLHNIPALIHPLSWGQVRGRDRTGVWGGHDYPTVSHVADIAHSQGAYVAWAHFPLPDGELAVSAALGKLDAAEVMMWGDPLAETMEGIYDGPGPFAAWYRLLNCGFRISAVAGTDKMHNSQVIGSPRVYARVNGEFNYQNWIRALEAGRTFVTSGPMLIVTFNGEEPGAELEMEEGGRVEIEARVRSFEPVEHVEVVVNGEVLEVHDTLIAEGNEVNFRTSIEISRGSWVAVRARSDARTAYQKYQAFDMPGIPLVAHTSPVYLTVAGKRAFYPDAARQLITAVDKAISWVHNEANYLDESHRAEVLAVYAEGRNVYERLLSEH